MGTFGPNDFYITPMDCLESTNRSVCLAGDIVCVRARLCVVCVWWGGGGGEGGREGRRQSH